ncbi:hypothetical protein HHL28_17430 [Aerophototrophica crusticola]|uniref:Uncharacterized protein n=1 Tax=Aerophototrophica crusticola TaxID=1709002 RepID=A0A858RB29_9PROT|nr:hypothetical protein HHL28_17430 [Rhodospirillaceae bacterium B3]
MDGKAVAEYASDLQLGLRQQDVPEYKAIRKIGMSAVLAMNIRGLDEINYRILQMAAPFYFGIPSYVLDDIVSVLEEIEFIKVVRKADDIVSIIPDVPFYEDVFHVVGDYASTQKLREVEQLTVSILEKLQQAPQNVDTLAASLGADTKLFKTSIGIAEKGGLLLKKRARGKDILVSPLYFSDSLEALADLAARGDSKRLQRLISLISSMQGMPLSLIRQKKEIKGTALSAEDIAILEVMAADGILKPPRIVRPDNTSEDFIFTPQPGSARLNPARREIYEKAMALAAAVRKGELLPEAYRIRNPQALLASFQQKKFLRANTEATHQYKNLSVMNLGKLRKVGGGFSEFHLIDIDENHEAIKIAKQLLAGRTDIDTNIDPNAIITLSSDEEYVRSQISRMTVAASATIISDESKKELEQLWLF